MPDASDTLAIRMAHEEVVYLLRALEIDAVGSATRNALEHLEQHEQALVLAVADRTLRARGIVRWVNVDERRVDQVVTEVFRACAGGQYAVTVETGGSQTVPRRVMYLISPRRMVEMSSPEPGIHEFITSSDHAAIAERLRSMIQIEPMHDSFQMALTVSSALIARAWEAAGRDPQTVYGILGAELAPHIAHAIADAMTHPVVVYTIELKQDIADRSRMPQPTALQVIQGARCLWLLESFSTGAISVRSGGTESAIHRVRTLLDPVLNALGLHG